MVECSTCFKPEVSQRCTGCGNVVYCNRLCQKKDWKQHKNICKAYEVKGSPGKGLGLFATRSLNVGDLIVCEKPIMVVSGQISNGLNEVVNQGVYMPIFIQAVCKLTEDTKEKVLSLFAIDLEKDDDEMKRILKIFRRNCISVKPDSDENDQAALYYSISRINHSCVPNSNWSWKETSVETKEVRAIRNIKKGEEITASYLSSGENFPTKNERQNMLSIKWLFNCKCELCSAPSKENDEYRRKIKKLHDDLPLVLQRDKCQGTRMAFWRVELMKKTDEFPIEICNAYLELYESLVIAIWAGEQFSVDDLGMGLDFNHPEFYREKALQLAQSLRLFHLKFSYNTKMERIAARYGVKNAIWE